MSHDEIHKICKKYDIKNYTINGDDSIDVDGDADLNYKSLTKLPLKFNKVGGYFNCVFNKLRTLEGAPKKVGGGFICHNNPGRLDYDKYLKKAKRINKLSQL